ncbi:hypothetical protein [Nocardioides bruguierae]|uniref:Uncharacterized protein n=1 Tax=Nocardioides bruguierae TaxID=2945102 RepID=A0A9X2IFF5_9ACTN|nr:hypothetical protein [Nocardioides bruguierae]MCM0621786.1 hypothetical protein [Nocardioides bruguierae]
MIAVNWSDEDGLHEGYVLPEFGDDVRGRGRGIWSGSVPADHVIVGVDDDEDAREPGAPPPGALHEPPGSRGRWLASDV